MFYLKYRPKKFAEVIGLANVVKTLQAILLKKEFPHAYLFTGPRGSGKTTTARLLAKAINCEKPIPTEGGIEVCNECEKCRAINEGRFLDLIEIDAASNRGIDDVRELRERVRLAPTSGKFKVYIIDEAHMLTIEAFNALLKTLEEPPPHAVFILATTEPQKIPETIKSRCQIFNFRRADRESLLKKIRKISLAEGLSIEEEKIEEILHLAEGGFRDAETLLEQVASGFSEISSTRLVVPDFVDLLLNGRKSEALGFVNELYDRGESLNAFNQNLLHYLRDLLLAKSVDRGGDISKADSGVSAAQAKALSYADLFLMINSFIKADQESKMTPIPQLPLEMAILSILNSFGGAEKNREETSSAGDSSESDRPGSHSLEDRASGEKVAGPTAGLEEIRSKWPEFLSLIRPENHSLEALMRSTRLASVGASGLTVEVFYKFHKEKLSLGPNLTILEKVLESVYHQPLKLTFILGEAKKVDRYQREKAEPEEDIQAEALKAFVGS